MYGFVGITPPGLPGFHGCGYAAVDKGQVIIPADLYAPIPKRNIFMTFTINGGIKRIYK